VAFVVGLFDTSLDLNDFKQHLRDFLITVKEFASEDNTDLYAEETEAGIYIYIYGYICVFMYICMYVLLIYMHL
jgi:hypothetical protein